MDGPDSVEFASCIGASYDLFRRDHEYLTPMVAAELGRSWVQAFLGCLLADTASICCVLASTVHFLADASSAVKSVMRDSGRFPFV